ncbi:MAG: MarC family protein [Candidatus Omnitrophica bacterium]|nr:MarC family protein [Candidatus Omnitrophota bacterium]
MIKVMFLAFIPLFVAVDAIGVLPIFVSLTEKMGAKERLNVILKSLVTAILLAIVFIFLGKAIFRVLNITVADFMVAGGILLFCIAIIDLLNPTKRRRIPAGELGFVPLGTPLIVGPAVLTTSLLMLDIYGLLPTLVSVLTNIILAGVIFLSANIFIRFLGVAGTRALSKITSLLLAAIAVMMIRKGIIFMLGT